MKILFYGAGVMGSLYAARLKESGQDVSILARGQRLVDIREHGIVLEDVSTGNKTTTRVNVVERLDPEDAYDLVVVMMPKNHVPEILPILAANRYIPNVLFMVNNAAGPDEMIQIAKEFKALAKNTSVPTPAMDRLFTYTDPDIQPVADGSAQIPMWPCMSPSYPRDN
jgi:2-dehydropantoate 2-reductase